MQPAFSRPELTLRLARGVQRLWVDRNYAPLLEFTLGNGRRADILALGPKGEIVIVETKSGPADYAVDAKWPDYLNYCDRFYFGVSEDFPQALLPPDVGIIVADAFGGEILREPPSRALPGARRRAMLLQFARVAAYRLSTPSLSISGALTRE